MIREVRLIPQSNGVTSVEIEGSGFVSHNEFRTLAGGGSHVNIMNFNTPIYVKVSKDMISFLDERKINKFEIDKVIFNGPTTIVKWKDGTKTVVKCQEGDCFDPEKGIAMCFTKKALGNKGNFNNVLKKHMPKVKTIEININLGHCVKEALENFSKAYFGGKK